MPASASSPQQHAATRATTRASAQATSTTALSHLSVVDLEKGYPDRRVLSGVSFTAAAGDRIGLIGENGTGKSTLLRVIAGLDTPDSGTVSVPGTVDLLQQELPYPEDSPISRVLDDAQHETIDALQAIEAAGEAYAGDPANAEHAAAYAEALERAEQSGAWDAASRRAETLTGLGLGGISEHTTLNALSGGMRLRLALAAILLRAPHTILLDEPSNHLDDASAAYLERVLADWPGIVIVASHDRALLDAVSTRILDLDPLPVAARDLADADTANNTATANGATGVKPDTKLESTDDTGAGFGVRMWGLGYSAARAERQSEMRRWRERYESEQGTLQSLAHEIEVGSREVNRKHESKSESRITKKFYADKDARVTARRARNARVRLEVLERDRVRRPPEPLRFRGFDAQDAHDAHDAQNAQAEMAGPLLSAQRVAFAGRLRETSVELSAGDQLLLTGPNGAGKSTLLAILAGRLEPSQGTVDSGAVDRGATDRIGYLPQEVSFADLTQSATAVYREFVGADAAEQIPLVDLGLLAARDLERPVGSLSVGQRRRLALAALVADPPGVLLLDEPTNHLSLTLVEDLEPALRTYRGALVVASHDRWLRHTWRGSHTELRPASVADDHRE